MQTNKQDFVDNKEQKGKDLFLKLASWKSNSNSSPFKIKWENPGSHNDLKILSGESNCLAEIKVRNIDIQTTLKYHPYCEFTKWDGMRRKAIQIEREKNLKIQLLYIEFLIDGILIYELKDIKQAKWKWVELPDTSFDNNKIDKYVTELLNPIEIIKYEDIKTQSFPLIGSSGFTNTNQISTK